MDGSGSSFLNHYGPFKTFPHVSLKDAYDNRLSSVLPEALILGGTATGINDIRPSPFDERMQGVEHHVAAVENILEQNFLSRDFLQFGFELLLTVLIAVFSIYFFSKSSLISFVFFLSFVCLLFLLDFYLFFLNNLFFYSGTSLVQLGLSYLGISTIRFFSKEKEAVQIRSAFQHYLHPEIVKTLVENPSLLRLSGEKKTLTVLFSDIRNFTTLSETLQPEELSSLLNEYLTPMSELILKSQGVLDKYIGDAIMAFWGAPLELSNHADRGIATALAMVQKLEELKKTWTNPELSRLMVGIGVNSGPMVVGNMGSKQRFDFTVLGDSVNLGARLEALTKEYGVSLLCSEMTLENLKNPEYFLKREIDCIRVKGKSNAVKIFEIMAFAHEVTSSLTELGQSYQESLSLYYKGHWKEARVSLTSLLSKWPTDGPAKTLLKRMDQEPPSDWEGIWVMRSK
jgi:adenylate cyclase